MVEKHSRTMVSAFLVFCLCLWHLVDGTDEVMSVSVMEGDSVSLNTSVTEVQNYHLIQWMFGETRIAEINNLIKSSSIYGTDDDKTLQNRLNLDPQTGSLTITNTRTTDSGLYQLILTSGETRSKSFRVTVSGVFGADELKSVMEGDSVTLHNDLTQIKKFYLLEWKFGDSVIARTDGKDISYPSPTEIFRDRLQLDETGSLTIKNMKARLSGLYELQIRHSAGISKGKFNVTVHESPSIAGQAEVKSLSVKQGAPVTLQTDVTQLDGDELIVWRFGDEGRLIAKADMEAKSSTLYDTEERFRGRLELDQTGSLTITNTRTTDSGFYTVKISSKKQTSYQRFTLTVSDCTRCCDTFEAAIRLVVAAVVGVAAVAVLVYDIRSTRSEQHRKRFTIKPME